MTAATRRDPSGPHAPAPATPAFELRQDAFGRLLLCGPDDAGQWHEQPVVAVRAFPISAPAGPVSLVDGDGHERAWIARPDELPEGARHLLQQALTEREFMPLILRLNAVSSFATPSTWDVETDRGATRFVLKGEENIRRMDARHIIVADAHGVQYLIRDLAQMDRASRKLLDRFL